jgi:hypothetical protein
MANYENLRTLFSNMCANGPSFFFRGVRKISPSSGGTPNFELPLISFAVVVGLVELLQNRFLQKKTLQ